jgi:hypothetical protein
MKKKSVTLKKNVTLKGQTAKVDAIAARLRVKTETLDAFSGFADPWDTERTEHGIGPTTGEKSADGPEHGSKAILDRYHWKEVYAPRAWYPKIPGTELVGFYGGRTTRSGSYGQYDVVLVHVPMRGSYMISGTNLMQLVDAAMIDVGHPVRVVWDGLKSLGVDAVTGKERKMKLFKLSVAEGDPIDVADLPRPQEWIAVLSYWRDSFIKGDDSLPYVPAARVEA